MEEIECLYTKLIKYHSKKSEEALNTEIPNPVENVVIDITITNQEEILENKEISEG